MLLSANHVQKHVSYTEACLMEKRKSFKKESNRRARAD